MCGNYRSHCPWRYVCLSACRNAQAPEQLCRPSVHPFVRPSLQPAAAIIANPQMPLCHLCQVPPARQPSYLPLRTYLLHGPQSSEAQTYLPFVRRPATYGRTDSQTERKHLAVAGTALVVSAAAAAAWHRPFAVRPSASSIRQKMGDVFSAEEGTDDSGSRGGVS